MKPLKEVYICFARPKPIQPLVNVFDLWRLLGKQEKGGSFFAVVLEFIFVF